MHTTLLNKEPYRFSKNPVTFGDKLIKNLIDSNENKCAAVIEYEGVIHNRRKVVTSCVVNTCNERYDYTDQVAAIISDELGPYNFTWDCKITLKPLAV